MKKTLKIVLMMALCLTTVIAFTACSGGSDDASAEKAVYKVATEPTYPPFDTTDKDGELTGFDMDLIAAIGEDQGFDVEFQAIGFDALIPALQSDNSDIIIAALNVTDERKEQVDFSDAYYKNGVVIMVKKGNKDITGWDSFTEGCSFKVAAQTGTTQADVANKLKEEGKVADAVILDQNTTALEQLTNGDVDALLIDLAPAVDITNSQADKYEYLPETNPDTQDDVAIAVKKGNTELMDKINAGLKNIKDNGKYDELVEKWNLPQN